LHITLLGGKGEQWNYCGAIEETLFFWVLCLCVFAKLKLWPAAAAAAVRAAKIYRAISILC